MPEDRELIERLCNLEVPNDIKISPSGEKVLYSTSLTWGHRKGEHHTTTLWLATLGQANSSTQITDGRYRDHSLAWHPLRDEFAFISDRAKIGVKSAIFSISLQDLETVSPVTSIEHEQPIEKFKFSPDGKMIAFISKDERTMDRLKQNGSYADVQVWGQDQEYSRLRIIDLETHETRMLSMDKNILDVCWESEINGDSEALNLAFVCCKSTDFEYPYRFGTEIYVIDSQYENMRKVCDAPNRANDLCWGTTNYGESEELYFWSGTRANENFRGNTLYKVHTPDGSRDYEEVGLEEDVTSLQCVDGKIVVKVQHDHGDHLIWVGTKTLHICPQEIEAYDVALQFSDGQDVVVVAATSNVNHPFEVLSIESRYERKVQLSNHGKPFQGQEFGTCKILRCTTADEYDIVIDGIYLEPIRKENVTGPCPTIVLLHGGPYMRVTNGFNALYYMWTPYLLSLGYAILMPNYRGSSGRGQGYSCFSYEGVGMYAYSDIIALTQCAIEQGYADPDRLVVGGYSHGGLLTNLCAVRNGSHGHGWRFKAAISGASISDIDTMSLTSDVGGAYQGELHNDSFPWTMNPEDTSTREASALWAFKEVMEQSKKTKKSIIPPMLILHGAEDARCHVAQAWGLRRALEHYSLPFEMAIYARQGHMFHEQYAWIDMALRIGRWVERCIGPAKDSIETSK